MDYPHPLYLRLAQGKQDRMIYEPGKYDLQNRRWPHCRDGSDVTIFCHGEMVFESLEAADMLAKEESLHA